MERYFFDEHAQAIAKRQYLQPGDGDILGMFRRVAREIAKPEKPEERAYWEEKFFELMSSKRFSPGGRILAGAGTAHGNLLNCFVQGATENPPESFAGIMEVAKKLALVTKVGGGNGVNLDPYRSRGTRKRRAVQGVAYLSAGHPDVEDFIRGLMRPPINPDGPKEEIALKNFARVVYGEVSPELKALAERYGVALAQEPPGDVIRVPDDMGGIVEAAKEAADLARRGLVPHVDFSLLRPEGAPIRGSGGTSSGPVSFLFEIFDNFLEWAALGAEEAGPVATLRYVYAPVLRVVRQGGCLHPDTLVHTDRGTLRLCELVDPFRRGWQRHTLSVATDEGWRPSPEGYNNGVAPTLRVVLENGLEVQGTPNHKLKVLREDGTRAWVELQELKPGDWVIWVLDEHTGTPVQLAPLDEPFHPNATPIRTPEVLTEDLAFLLGFFFGEGFVSGDRLGFSVHEDEPMREEVKRLFRELFGLELREEKKPGDRSVTLVVRSRPLVTWLKKNGLLKGKARELEVPRAIRQSPRPVLAAFLRGLFEADGTVTAGYPMLATASKRLAQDVMVLLGGLGIPSKLLRYNPRPGRFSKAEHYRVRVVTAKGLERYLERIGVPQGSRLEALYQSRPDTRRESSWPLPHAEGLLRPLLAVAEKGGKGHVSPYTPLRKDLLRYLRGERQLTATGYTLVQEKAQGLGLEAEPFAFNEYYVRVAAVEPGGEILTLDLSVEGNHTYLANGLVSHNTRRGAGMATLSIEHPDLLDFLTAKDLDREKAEGDISTFNISVLVSDAFMRALEQDALWPVTPIEVPGKYYPYPLEGPYTGKVPELPEREDGAKAIPLYEGKVPARWLWHEIAWHAWATGEPGLIFVDRVNALSALKGLGERYQIRSTNPCFVGSTRVPTEYGLVPIAELAEKPEGFFLVTDNRAPFGGVGRPMPHEGTTVRRAAKAFFTGVKPVVRLRTREGLELTLTPDHPVLTPLGYREVGSLRPGDRILIQSGEGLFPKEVALPAPALAVVRERVATAGSRGGAGRADVRAQYANLPTQWSRELGVALGWLVGDGYLREDGVGFYFSREDFQALGWLVDLLRDWLGGGTLQETSSNTYHLHFKRIPAEFFQALGVKVAKATEKRVPESLFRAPREAVVGFLQGLFSADGSVQLNPGKKDATVRLASSSLALLQDVQLLLLNLGIFGKIYRRRAAGKTSLPDGRGGLKEYPVAEQYELILGARSRDRFAEVVGFLQEEKQARLCAYLQDRPRGSYRKPFVAVVERLEALGEAPVYDLTEPVTHSLIANGLVCHNCGEIPLTVGEPCDLGALNLAAYVKDGEFQMEAFREDVRTAIRFLDNVLDVNRFALKDNEEAAKRLRRLGLGVMGLADMLIRLDLPYNSEAARQKVYEILSAMREEAIRASEDLAEERGPFPLYEEHREYFEALGIKPRRNVAVLTVAPTGTTSMLMGVSSGIEPVFSPFVWRRIGGEYKPLLHPLFVELMEAFPPAPGYEKDGKWDWDKIVEEIQKDGHGSVQNLPFVPETIRKVFLCAHDIHPLDHVRMQGVVQRAFDAEGYAGNSLSKCLAKGTLIPTSRGLIPVEEIAPPHPEDTFVPVEGLYTAEGYRITAHYFAGKKRGVRVRLDNGAELVGAWESHRVLTPEGWRLMRDLKPGDLVLGKLVPSHGPGGAPIPLDFPRRTNAKALPLPECMSPELALFLGMLAADGATVERTGFVGIATKSPEVEAAFRNVAYKLFGAEPKATLDKRTGVRNVYLLSRRLARYVEALIGKGAKEKRVPSQILQGSPEEKLAFLRGLTLDGYARQDQGLILYEGKSRRLAYEAAEVARSFGLPWVYQGRKKVRAPRETYFVHSVVVSGPLQELVEPIESHKRIPRVDKRYRVFVPEEILAATRVGVHHPGYNNLKSVRDRGVSHVYNRTADRLGWPTEVLAFRVVAVEDAGEVEMYDIEVEDVHRYVVNGIISHNTINLPHEATVADVEAAYTEAYRTGCKGITVYRDGSREFQVLTVKKEDKEVKEERREAPDEAPQGQEAKRGEGGPVYERPGRLMGFTDMVKLLSPEGTKRSFLVTVNLLGDRPIEVILTSGKAGDEANADSEALGRVVSIALQYGVPPEAIVRTLRGINGGLYGTYQGRLVSSKADLIAVALETIPQAFKGMVGAEEPLPSLSGGGLALPGALPCPVCGEKALVREEGCYKCQACGYSKCG
ncbi:ribonucleoside-diphosphate reductase [Thermus sp. 2.9]|uniref:intein-containing adenosylcobalamin-dependent ribonucleoside-diphosphate reductase n=1 Tax=Thermus sp. (strain 2.9) TaxID=1577051 RepID=UPI0005444D0C|nr:intein-containing adenosylcobalamin-dependent ribonucleoside-diphosphate reductase [Thermus sp. 2.9]KHG66602.1 ribonucleoside-diphosphate reductase [Thermus sp. 2.9]